MSSEHDYVEIKTGILYRERKVLNELRAAARRGEFQVLVIYDLDRLSRDPVQQMIVMEDLTYYGVRVECCLREIDYSPKGQLVLFMQGYAAKLEHERTRDRSTRGQRARVEEGKPSATGRPRYGYLWANQAKAKYDLNPKIVYVTKSGNQWREGDIVSYVFDLADSGYSLNRIIAALNEAHIPTANGNDMWTTTTVRRILTDPIYIGKPIALKWKIERDSTYTRIVKHRAKEEQIHL